MKHPVRHRSIIIAVLMICFSVIPISPFQPPVAHAAPSCSRETCDGQDPQATGCSADGRNAGATGIYERRDNPTSRKIATVELRWSPSCQTFWSRILLEPNHDQRSATARLAIALTDTSRYDREAILDSSSTSVWSKMAYIKDDVISACGTTARDVSWSVYSSCASVSGIGTFQIVAAHSNKCLDVNGGVAATGDGVTVHQWTCGVTAKPNQLWRIVPMNNSNSFQIVVINSGKCLDVNGGRAATGDGVKIHQWECGDASRTNQLWRLLW